MAHYAVRDIEVDRGACIPITMRDRYSKHGLGGDGRLRPAPRYYRDRHKSAPSQCYEIIHTFRNVDVDDDHKRVIVREALIGIGTTNWIR